MEAVTGDEATLQACLQAATFAPSIHNSRPWRFRVRADGIDVYGDWRRRLELIDPDGRQLTISVGAAMFNLRLAIHQCGQRSGVRPARARVKAGAIRPMAAVDIAGAALPDPVLDDLAAAMPLRHTNRRPFLPDPVPPALRDELIAAAAVEGATLQAVTEPARGAAVGRIVRAAEAKLRAVGVYRAELPEWSRSRPAVGWHAVESLPLRDFGLLTPHRREKLVPARPYPLILLLGTHGDTVEDRLRAGQALQRVWLTATARGLALAPMSQPLEVPFLRRLVATPEPGDWPQVILLLGYAPPS